MPEMKTWTRAIVASMCLAVLPTLASAADAEPNPAEKISYYKQIRPIFQAQCQGCHQPAKPNGGYVMTAFDRLLAGGDSDDPAIVPFKPEDGKLLEQIVPADGKAEMPRDKPPLHATEIELIRLWMVQGAVDDTPVNAKTRYDIDHPPVYGRAPVVAALDFSPDGQYLAVSGFHEVVLWKTDGSEPIARLIGLSERIESIRFSPDGTRLAVTGGLPGRMGELQIWDVAKRKLTLSVPLTFDTVFGASWSPDGSKVAVGCTDNSVRALDAKTGEQVLFMGSHNDWALDTAFSVDGSHLISVGRDMAAKLTETSTQRFIDNITSITPGALKGGIASVARHPRRDEIVMGGSDGVPKLYRIFRQTARVIGDDSNMIRLFEPMKGWVSSVAISADGKRFAAGSSLDGAGAVHVYNYDFETGLTDALKAIEAKDPGSRTPEETKALNDFHAAGTQAISKIDLPQTGIYAVAFRPDGQALAAAGSDGVVRLFNPDTGALIKEFVPVTLGGVESSAPETVTAIVPNSEEAVEAETVPTGATVVSLDAQPAEIHLTNRFAYVQLLVSGTLDTGDRIDVTRMVTPTFSAPIARISRSGQVRPLSDGNGSLSVTVAGKTLEIPVVVSGMTVEPAIDFVHDVAPILSKLGCNQGTCHGSAKGKNGFKLSLRGYDPIFDVRALTEEHASRRVNVASPDDSLMLLKSTGAVPHTGGPVMQPGEPYFETIRNWIVRGAKLNTATPKVVKIELSPQNPTIQQIGLKQQMRVLATYADGEIRDVTRETFIETGNGEVATANRSGLMSALRRGEAPMLARFEGAYAATTLTVMGDRDGFAWTQPPSYGKIDDLVAAKWLRMKIIPSEVCGDAEFLRRVTLDLTGLPPTADEVRSFLADARDSRVKRDELVDRLIGNKEYVEFWTNKWADLLQVNRKFLGTEGAAPFRKWIRDQVAANVPYDKFVASVLDSKGSNREHPEAAYYKILRDPADIMENTTQLFLGVRFNCNKCHDHPFEKWTQDQYYQTAAYFAQVGLKADPASGDRQIGGTAVEGGKPLFEEVYDTGQGEMKHDRTGDVTPPKFPYPATDSAPETATRREHLVSWLTSKDNRYFARSYVNRLWGYLLGVGIIEPLDDIRAGNPPTNPELLDYLTEEFVNSGFDAQHVVRLICKSRTYQLSLATNKWNADDKINFSHATARRLPAEVLYDTVYRVMGAVSNIPGVAPGTRAAELPDSGVELPSGFLSTFGRPVRESACECERSSGLQLGPVMALVSGPTVADAIADPNNELTKLTARDPDDADLINELFLRVLSRPATPAEIESCRAAFAEIDADHKRLAEELGKREMEAALARPQKEREREAAIASAKSALAAYEAELAPKTAELERQKAEKTAALEADLKTFEETGIPAKIAEWEKAKANVVAWRPLDARMLEATNGAVLTKEPDLSISVSGKNEKGIVTVVVETDLTNITGLRLEALPDDRLPNHGPGRATDGNFVLTEFDVTATSKVDPKKTGPVPLQNALADFSQNTFEVAKAIDGDLTTANNGWALSPTTGVVHWATFETKEPAGFEGGTVLTFRLHHQFAESFMLGRFRISATQAVRPVGLDLPEDLRAIVATAPETRTDAQKATLLSYFRVTDNDLRGKVAAIAASKAPLPVDPKLKELRDAVETASKPVPLDPTLARLRKDIEMSVLQATTRRLTAAQDIAWALINSPAFLFNH